MSIAYKPIDDIADKIIERLETYCPLVRSRTKSGVTDHKAMAEQIQYLGLLPAAVVIMGPWETIQQGGPQTPATMARHDNLGILLVVEYSAEAHAGAEELWDVLDQVTGIWIPSADRSEDLSYPVCLFGTQGQGGLDIIPAGWIPLQGSGSNKAAGVLNLIAVNRLKEW